MNTQNVSLALEITILIGGLYLAFFKSYFKEKGKNLATLEDIAEITTIVEELKSDFQKQNISYQITLTELTKIRFDRIDNLYVDLINLQSFVKEKMFYFNDANDFVEKKKDFLNYYNIANISRYKCNLYISVDLKQKIIDVLDGAFNAYMAFAVLYRTDTRDFGDIDIFNVQKQQLLINLSAQNNNALSRLDKIIDDFPLLLNSFEEEAKKQILIK